MAIYTISNQMLKFSVSSLGAEPKSLKTGNREWLVQYDNGDGTGFSPVLFPMIGPLKNDIHVIDDKAYRMPMHGFAKNSVFDVTEKTENSISFMLTADSETKKMYPYDFRLSITYTLNNNRLMTKYKVSNEGNRRMHYAIGSHIGYCLGTDKDKYSIIFDHNMEKSKDILIYNASEVFTFEDERLDIKDEFFESGCVVIKVGTSASWELVNKTDNSKISFISNDFPYLTLWSIPGQPLICLEPWSFRSGHFCEGNSLSELPEISSLDSGETKNFEYVLSFYENKI